MDVIELTKALVDIPSVTGQEKAAGDFLHDHLRDSGWQTHRQPVAENRFNVVALRGAPEILLSTHYDTVPPFIPSGEDDRYLHGRGSCDAKGIAASLISAAQELVKEGMSDLGMLFVVGEEVDGIGAKTAARSQELRCRYFINGEPTENLLAVGHKGVYLARLQASGVCSHSGYPEEGSSAIHDLLDVIADLRSTSFPHDDLLGESYLNIGTIEGGQAPNVLADSATASLLIRTVVPCRRYQEMVERIVAGRVTLKVDHANDPQHMERIEGFEETVVGYGTDVPALRPLGRPLLFGPGTIRVAHTDKERILKDDLKLGVENYKKIVRILKARIRKGE